MTRLAWSEVPRPQMDRFADVALAESSALAHEILRAIRQEFPELRLVEGESGEPKALVGIRRAIEGFVHHLASGAGAADPRVPSEVFQEFGRGEGLNGRSLDSLQAVYRLGVRLAWRRFAEIGQQVDIAAPAMYELAESGFKYLDGLVEQSVRGYAEAAARQEGERLRLQRRLIDRLLSGPHADPAQALGERAARIGWELPATVAVGLLIRPAREAVAPALGRGILLDMESEQPRLVIPDPDTAGRVDHVRHATAGWSGAIGPTVPLASAVASLRWAETAVTLTEEGLLPHGEVQHCTDRMEELLLLPSHDLVDAVAARCLTPLNDVAPTQARRLADTLLAWIETSGGAPEVAHRLGVHPQTARYRLRQIRELWGDALDDPDRRFELLLVLRSRRLRTVPPTDGAHPGSTVRAARS
ncbi:helix-turn-helix domain-containing protein [Streptomyces sp. NPDC007863]|uniref:PucR family transcriptional regulator n=1 Tax=Streptomyces sp. NPDC007863 TaxID=3154894 RepID=UPI0033CB69B4